MVSFNLPSLNRFRGLSLTQRLRTPLRRLKDAIDGLSQKGKLDKELKGYQSLAQSAPGDVRVKLKMAELFFRKRDIAQAVALYEEVAAIYDSEKLIMKAIDAYHNVLRLCPTDVRINEKLGNLYREATMPEEALQQYEIAFHNYRSQGSSVKALQMCENMIAISPNPHYRRKLGEIYQAIGNIEEAVKEYETIATAYRRDKNYDALLEVYKLLLPHRPEKQPLMRDMAILYLHKKSPQESIRLLDRAGLQDDPQCQEIYDKARAMVIELAHT